MQIRPFIEMRVGQINLPVRVPISPLLVDAATTTLSANTAAGTSSLTVASNAGFRAPFSILIGEPGNENSEIVICTGVSGNDTITLDNSTVFPHSASTKIYFLRFNKIQIYTFTTPTTGEGDPVVTLNITANTTTDYNDMGSNPEDISSFYYFARYIQVGVGAVTDGGIDTGGGSYAVGNILTLVGGDGNAQITVTSVDGGGQINGASIRSGGSGYTTAIYSLTGGDGSGATYSAVETDQASPFSDPAPYAGYATTSVGYIKSSALNEINKALSQTLTDEFIYQQIDNVQTEVIQLLKRWSFMQKFDQTVGHAAQGSWKFTLPTDIGNDKSNKSIYQLRVGTQQRLVWVDKQKFDEFLVGVAYSTLAEALTEGVSVIVLTDSSSFNSLASQTSDGSGTVTIGAYTYAYSANDTTTGILTLTTPTTVANVQPVGADVFQGATQGLPNYWTTYGGKGYYWPIVSQSYNGFQLLMDYYSKQLKITSDSNDVVFPDTTVAIYYLCWKMLKKLNNGTENESSLAYKQQYEAQKEKMRVKEVMNRTFKLRPRIQNFSTQSAFSESTPRWVRDAEFPNTGF